MKWPDEAAAVEAEEVAAEDGEADEATVGVETKAQVDGGVRFRPILI